MFRPSRSYPRNCNNEGLKFPSSATSASSPHHGIQRSVKLLLASIQQSNTTRSFQKYTTGRKSTLKIIIIKEQKNVLFPPNPRSPLSPRIETIQNVYQILAVSSSSLQPALTKNHSSFLLSLTGQPWVPVLSRGRWQLLNHYRYSFSCWCRCRISALAPADSTDKNEARGRNRRFRASVIFDLSFAGNTTHAPLRIENKYYTSEVPFGWSELPSPSLNLLKEERRCR